MNVAFLASLQQAAQNQPQASTVVQTIWLALTILGVLSIIVVGFTAKKIENIHNPTYSKAFLAQFLVGLLSTVGFFLFGLFLQAPPLVALGLAYSVIPILIYRIVFASMWSEAAIIWVVVTLVQVGVGYGMVLTGLVSLAAFTSA